MTARDRLAEMLRLPMHTAVVVHDPANIVYLTEGCGGEGAVYASREGENGTVPAVNVDIVDTTGCGDAFFAGVCIGLSYGKNLENACQIGTRLASSVIATRENVCPRFLPAEFGLPEVE